jgi:hypothetical protein
VTKLRGWESDRSARTGSGAHQGLRGLIPQRQSPPVTYISRAGVHGVMHNRQEQLYLYCIQLREIWPTHVDAYELYLLCDV